MKSKAQIKMPLSIIRTRIAAAITKLSANIEEEIDSDASRSSKCTRGESLLENEKGAKVDSVIESKEEGVKALMLNENDGGMELAGDHIWTPAHSSAEEDNGDSPHNRVMGFGSDSENERRGTKSWAEVQLNEAEKGIVAAPYGRREPLQSAPMAGERNVGEDEGQLNELANPHQTTTMIGRKVEEDRAPGSHIMGHGLQSGLVSNSLKPQKVDKMASNDVPNTSANAGPEVATFANGSKLARALKEVSPMVISGGAFGPQSPNPHLKGMDMLSGQENSLSSQQIQNEMILVDQGLTSKITQVHTNVNSHEMHNNIQIMSISPKQGNPNSWADITAGSSKVEKLSLHYFKPTKNAQGVPSIKPPLAVAVESRKQWSNCLVGSFLDRKPSFHIVQSIADRMWKKYGLLEVMMNNRGVFFFKVRGEIEMRQCLEEGPWLFKNKPIHLQKWKSAMDLYKEIPKVVPLWVKLYDVPMEYWTTMGLSYIVSGIGRPLSLDKMTEETCRSGVGRIGFARVLVEVGATENLPDLLEVSTPCEEYGRESLMNVRVEYQWKPSRCAHCMVFGHTDTNCPIQPKPQKIAPSEPIEPTTIIDQEGFTKVQRKGKEKSSGEPSGKRRTFNEPSLVTNLEHSKENVRVVKATSSSITNHRAALFHKDHPPLSSNRFVSLATSSAAEKVANPFTALWEPLESMERARNTEVDEYSGQTRYNEGKD